jgi:hypothetical protein
MARKTHHPACRPEDGRHGRVVWHHAPVSFDLVVWAMDSTDAPDAVRAANARCARGEHPPRAADPRVIAFYDALTGDYPDRGPRYAAAVSPWASAPLHAAADHIQMRLQENCPDAVLETIERLAGELKLDLLDLQDGTVYPPPARTPPARTPPPRTPQPRPPSPRTPSAQTP